MPIAAMVAATPSVAGAGNPPADAAGFFSAARGRNKKASRYRPPKAVSAAPGVPVSEPRHPTPRLTRHGTDTGGILAD